MIKPFDKRKQNFSKKTSNLSLFHIIHILHS